MRWNRNLGISIRFIKFDQYLVVMQNLFTALLLFFAILCKAQPFLRQLPPEQKITLKDVQLAAEKYWEGKNLEKTKGPDAEAAGYKQYKRWESFIEHRTWPGGEFPAAGILFDEYRKY